MRNELTVCIEQFIIRFRGFGIIPSKLKDLGKKIIPPVFDIGEHIIERIFELEATGQHREKVRDARRKSKSLFSSIPGSMSVIVSTHVSS